MVIRNIVEKSASRKNIVLPIACFTLVAVQLMQNVNHPKDIVKEPRIMDHPDTVYAKSIKLPKTQARRCNKTDDSISKIAFSSQSREDEFLLNEFFHNVCGGRYIEMGALDGERYSNSLFFNRALDWKGLLVEADPNNYKKLIENRKNELVTPVHAAVCDKKQDVHWVSYAHGGAVGGILEFAPKHFKDQWWNEKLIRNAPVIKCLPLNDIVRNANIDENGHAFFDFFSLDVEGAFKKL